MKITIKTGNAAFGDTPYEKAAELKRIFEKIVAQVERGYEDNVIMDINGNIVGAWKE
jgi:hypothetical protein